MSSKHAFAQVHGGWLIRLLCPAVVVIGIFVFAPSRAQASTIQPLSESEVVHQIQRYCAASWRNANLARTDWCDCSQQLLCELLEQGDRRHLEPAIRQADSEERKELNRAIWRIVKRQRRQEARSMLPLNGREPPHSLGAQETEELMAEVMHIGEHELSARQLRILQMTSEGHAIADIAKHLGIPATRVSDEKYQGIRRIRQRLNAE